MSHKSLVLYHKNCLDGFASAWIVGKWFGFHNVELRAVEYGEPIPDITGRDVYIVDFSYEPKDLIPVLKTVNSIVMLDHHKGAQQKWAHDWELNISVEERAKLVVLFDPTKSGVGVVWDFFHNSGIEYHVDMPFLLKLVQDYDLYQFKFPQTRYAQAALANGIMQKQDVTFFSEAVEKFECGDGDEILDRGLIVLEAQRVQAQAIIDRCAFEEELFGYKTLMCAMPYELRDIGGEILYKNRPFSITFEERPKEGITKFSVRSDPDHGENVLRFAQFMGGNGHDHAAGFVLKLTKGAYLQQHIADGPK